MKVLGIGRTDKDAGRKAAEEMAHDEPKVKTREKQTEHRRPRKKSTSPFLMIGGGNWGSPVHYPKRKKLKGWQKENRKYKKIS